MKENVGDRDRWLRVAVGGGLVLAGLRGLGMRSLGSGLLLAGGAVLLETAITRVCPLSDLLGIDTRNWDEPRFGEDHVGSAQLGSDETIGRGSIIGRPPADS